MATDDELRRLANMGNALRPDWPTASLLSHLRANHAARGFRDLAIALACVASDPETRTPARLAEDGPWWAAAQAAFGWKAPTPTGRRVACPRHPDALAGHCRECADEAVPPPPGWRPVLPKVNHDSPKYRAALAEAEARAAAREGGEDRGVEAEAEAS